MDRFAAMLILLSVLVSLIILFLALFAMAPVFCSCLLSLLYTLYLFMANEEAGVHHAQEFENRFWTIFALLFSTALFFAQDSPLSVGRWNSSLGFFSVLLSGYAMHTWDRMVHRDRVSQRISQQLGLRRSTTATSSLVRLKALGIPVEDQLHRIDSCLKEIDQLLIPSTINNFINIRVVLAKEREIISIFHDCDARALNYLICHVKLGLLFYKIKDHNNFSGQHRTELIQLLTIERLPILTVMSRVIVLHALQLMKLRANPRAELWVKNVILNTHQEDLSELKTLTDAKGDYFCMNKLIYDDIKSETARQEILTHIRKEATLQQNRKRSKQSWRKVLSDVDDTLSCSGGSYPAGIDRRFGKKVVYPGVLAFYRELDLGTQGPDEWPENKVGNLVFLSARPHVYKDMSEKINYAKFEKLRKSKDGQTKLHTMPSLLAGDLASGSEYIMKNDMEPLALKKFDNFKRYVSIYPEYKHLFVCDNGQGDVRAGEMMFDAFPYEFEALYVHQVQDVQKTYGYALEEWSEKGLRPRFFRTYPEAALDAVSMDPPLMRIKGLQRVCLEAVTDFHNIQKWTSPTQKAERLQELNQALWKANQFLDSHNLERVPLIEAKRLWGDNEKVRTPYGVGRVKGFDPLVDLYSVELDWRPLTSQVEEYQSEEKKMQKKKALHMATSTEKETLETVVELEDEEYAEAKSAKQGQVNRRSNASDDRKLASGSLPTAERKPAIGKQETTAVGTNLMPEDNGTTGNKKFIVTAKIQGKCISKFTPPVLPKVDKDRGPLFSFWNAPIPTVRKRQFKEGEQCRTPYGLGVVVEFREPIVVVNMVGWNAKGFIYEKDVEVVGSSVWKKLLRQFSTGDVTNNKVLEFPYAEGTIIKTPFGDAQVTKPLPEGGKSDGTIGLSLTAWALAEGAHPTLYCSVETARKWKENKSKDKPLGDGLFTAFGNLVSKTFRSRNENKVESKRQIPAPMFEQYYKDGASVSTLYGDGVVDRFRENDGFYEVSITSWKLTNGSCVQAILRKDDIKCRIAMGCHEGYPVLTGLGLTGLLASVEPTTGVHIVTIPSAGMVCYLQPESIVKPIKAAVGEDVFTAYGDGRVVQYNSIDDTYVINMHDWNAQLYAKAETLDRVGDGMQDRDGPFGMKWLLNMLFFSSETEPVSRSGSVHSYSVRSQSARSVK